MSPLDYATTDLLRYPPTATANGRKLVDEHQDLHFSGFTSGRLMVLRMR